VEGDGRVVASSGPTIRTGTLNLKFKGKGRLKTVKSLKNRKKVKPRKREKKKTLKKTVLKKNPG